MSDNTVLNAGLGGDTIATDDIAGVKYQRVKISVGADGSATDLSSAAPMPVSDNAGSLTVDGTVAVSAVTSITNALPAGTNAIGKLAANSGVDIGDVDVTSVAGTVASAGNVAHDAVDSGNPVKIGYNAVAVGTSPAAVAAGDRTDGYANRHGVPFVQPGHPNIVTVRANYTSAQTNAAIVAQAAGGKLVVTRVSVTADNANTDSPAVRIGFATATTPSTTGVLFSHPGLPAGFHCPEGNGGGILGIGADDEDLRITTGTISAGSIDVVVNYYVLPS